MKMKSNWKLHSFACTVGVLLMLFGSNAWANSIAIYDLGTGNASPGLACCTGPYAQVTIDLITSTTAEVTFDSLTNGGYIYLMGANQGVGINVNGTATTTGITATNSIAGFSPSASDGGGGTFDGFGNFSNSVQFADGFTGTATEVSFLLTDTSGTWSSAANVLAGNSDGNSLAIHGFACATPCTAAEGAAFTGFATGNTPVVPEPKTLPVVCGLLGLVAVGVRFRKRVAATS